MRFIPHNAVTLLESGADFFPALRTAIEHARTEIHIETYIFRLDRSTQPIADALIAAAQRGVACHVLVDGFGSRDFPKAWRDQFAAAGGQFLFYRPENALWRLRRSRLRRLHRKLAVIDARHAFVGGINLHDDCDDALPGFLPRYDYAVGLRGPIVASIYSSVKSVWQRTLWFHGHPVIVPRRPVITQPAGHLNALFLVRDNLRHRQSIETEYLTQIAEARREILIANAYFFPGFRFRHAIRSAARRGVRVVLLLQGQIDNPIFFYATQGLFQDFLRDGVEIYTYQAGYLHTKVAVIDRLWTTVGSSNLDPFSFLLAREANIVVKNHDFANRLRTRLLQRIQQHSVQIDPKKSEQSSYWHKLLMWGCYGLVRMGFGLAGLGQRYFRR